MFENYAISFMQVGGSSVEGPHTAVLVGGTGAVGALDVDDDEDPAGEGMEDVEAYGAPGIVFRPRPPESVVTDGVDETLGAEAMAARTSSGLVPMAWRDLRFNRSYSAPKSGSVAIVGYGGGFHSLEDTTTNSGSKKATTHVLYAPYDFDSDGIAQKAHCIIVSTEPSDEYICMVHGAGLALSMDQDNGITMRADGETFANLAPGKFTVVADAINLRGVVALGANTLTAVPLLAGPASPPSPSVYVSPV